ncbi:hypothetical protein SPD48_17645 [Pseudogracilibacillus sp. SE30717A]|uniref:hypothetical protein n=1 Tax=Pseudogracilibacillus sp. SE30717A TaxID=3098293 RepID=UPI00300E439D
MKEKMDGIEVTPLFESQVNERHQFKLTIDGDEYKGILYDENIEWFHPKPKRKLQDELVERVEKKVMKKVNEYKENYKDK